MDVQGEYIKRSDAIEAFRREREADIEQFGVEIPECFPAERAAGIVQFLPVFELRECKDCRYYDSNRSWCELHSHADWPEFEPDDFCSDYRGGDETYTLGRGNGKSRRTLELLMAAADNRVVVLPCKIGERWKDEGGKPVVITELMACTNNRGTNINIYFKSEKAQRSGAQGEMQVASWEYFERHYTREE